MNIVFDFGAVLFTWEPATLVRSHFGEQAATPEAALRLAQDIFGHDDWHGFDRGEHALEVAVQRIAERLALPPAALDAMLSPVGERLAPMLATVALLQRLRERRDAQRDLRLFFLSNMPAPYARTLEQRHAFLQWFDGGVFSGDVQLAKPDPAIYRLLAERHGLEPGRTVFIDDMAGNVEAARALGWHGIHFQSSAQLETGLDDWMAVPAFSR